MTSSSTKMVSLLLLIALALAVFAVGASAAETSQLWMCSLDDGKTFQPCCAQNSCSASIVGKPYCVTVSVNVDGVPTYAQADGELCANLGQAPSQCQIDPLKCVTTYEFSCYKEETGTAGPIQVPADCCEEHCGAEISIDYQKCWQIVVNHYTSPETTTSIAVSNDICTRNNIKLDVWPCQDNECPPNPTFEWLCTNSAGKILPCCSECSSGPLSSDLTPQCINTQDQTNISQNPDEDCKGLVKPSDCKPREGAQCTAIKCVNADGKSVGCECTKETCGQTITRQCHIFNPLTSAWELSSNNELCGAFEITTKCDPCDTQVKYEWYCAASINGFNIEIPCKDFCLYAERRWGEKFCYGDEFQFNIVTQCIVAGSQTSPNGIQIALSTNDCPQPAPATYNVEQCDWQKKCPHHWLCTVTIDGNDLQVPCDQLTNSDSSANLCKKLRTQWPCGKGEIDAECVNSLTYQVVADSFCTPQLPPFDSVDINTICPPAQGCGKTYAWECIGYNSDGTTINYPPTTVTNGDYSASRCPCGPTCTGYKLTSRCLDTSVTPNVVVDDSFCNPSTRPVPASVSTSIDTTVWCPANLPPERCGEKCNLICSIKIGESQIYFPCEQYKDYCYKFSQTFCDVDIIVQSHCGTLTPYGEFIEAKDKECCKRLTTPWNQVFAFEPTSPAYNCNKLAPVNNNPLPFTMSELAIIGIPRPQPCKYGWTCKRTLFDGTVEYGPCECNWLQKGAVDADGQFPCPLNITPDPICVQYTSYGSIVEVADTKCINLGLVEPTGFPSPCPEPAACEEDRKVQWMCSDVSVFPPLGPIDCANACDQFGAEGKHCKDFHISAECYVVPANPATSPVWTTPFDCYGQIGAPFTSSPYLFDTCPGNEKYCDNNNYDWQCHVVGNPWQIVPCKCPDTSDSANQQAIANLIERFGCQLNITRSCFDLFTSTFVADALCVNAPTPTPGVYPKSCKLCDTSSRVELQCYRNGDITQPIPCKHECRNGNCDSYYLQAICHAVGNPSVTYPLSTCAGVGVYASLPSFGFDTQGYKKCQSSKYDKYCNLKWVCRAYREDGTHFDYDCSQKSPCLALSQDKATRCTVFKIGNVCVNYNQLNPNDPTYWTQVSANACATAGVLAPLGGPYITQTCPVDGILPKDCYKKTYQYMCIDTTYNTQFPTMSEPYPCRRPTCESRRPNHIKPCEDFILSAQCFEVTYTAMNPTPTLVLVADSFCDSSTWPVLSPGGAPVSLKCPCKKLKCKNGAINYPLCNIFRIDEGVIDVNGGIKWNINGDTTDDVDDCLHDDVMVSFKSNDLAFNAVSTQTFSRSSGSIQLDGGINTSTLKNADQKTVTVTAQLIDGCGNIITLPDVTVDTFCTRAKCAAPFICSNEQQRCVCPPNTSGEKCEIVIDADFCAKTGQVFDETLQQCVCKGVIDPLTQQCVDRCPHEEKPTSGECGDNGKWSTNTCGCWCKPGFWGEKCDCFEVNFNVTLKTKPEQYDNLPAMWESLATDYFAFDFSALDIAVVKESLSITHVSQNQDGTFVVTFAFKTCNQDLFAKFIELYKQFIASSGRVVQDSDNTAAPFIALADDEEVAQQSSFEQSDVAQSAGGVTAYSQTYSEERQEPTAPNAATVVSMSMAVVVAVIVALLF